MNSIEADSKKTIVCKMAPQPASKSRSEQKKNEEGNDNAKKNRENKNDDSVNGNKEEEENLIIQRTIPHLK